MATIERKPRQFLAVWNDAGDAVKGATFEESLFVDGVFWKNELTPVAPEKFGDFGTLFSNDLQQQVDTLTAQNQALTARIAILETELPFNTRLISADGFRNRLFKVLKPADLVRLYAADADPTLEQIARTFSEWPSNVGIRLDHENLLNPLAYLKSIDLLSDKDIESLRTDCTREEAFKE